MIKSEKIYKFRDNEYPILKKSKETDFVVLFFEAGKGVVVFEGKDSYTDEQYNIGDYSATWGESTFETFDGEILLRNI